MIIAYGKIGRSDTRCKQIRDVNIHRSPTDLSVKFESSDFFFWRKTTRKMFKFCLVVLFLYISGCESSGLVSRPGNIRLKLYKLYKPASRTTYLLTLFCQEWITAPRTLLQRTHTSRNSPCQAKRRHGKVRRPPVKVLYLRTARSLIILYI